MLSPATEDELADLVRAARGPLSVRGGGTRGGGGRGEVLTTAGIAGIVLHEPGALTLVARAGTALSAVEDVLAAQGQRLAFEAPDLRGLLGTEGESTIGGVIATNASGPRRVQAGAARDFLLGVRFVDGTGAVVKNGGRVMKNVTGYDLVKLMAGSRGELGVITEVALKVLPVPAATATLSVATGEATALAALTAALSSPFDVTGAACLPGRGALVRIEGFAASVDYRAGRLRDLLSRHGSVEVETDPARNAALWKAVRDVEPFHGKRGDIWRISVRPSHGIEAARRLGAVGLLFDWGGGLVWALMPEGTDARARLDGLPGHATLVRAAPETTARIGARPPESPAVEALIQGLRTRFDPRGLFGTA